MLPEQLDLDWTAVGPMALVEQLAPITAAIDDVRTRTAFEQFMRMGLDKDDPRRSTALGAPRLDASGDPMPIVQQWADGRGAVGEWAAAEQARQSEQSRTAKREHARRADELRPAAEAEYQQARVLVDDWIQQTEAYTAAATGWLEAPPSPSLPAPLPRIPINLT